VAICEGRRAAGSGGVAQSAPGASWRATLQATRAGQRAPHEACAAPRRDNAGLLASPGIASHHTHTPKISHSSADLSSVTHNLSHPVSHALVSPLRPPQISGLHAIVGHALIHQSHANPSRTTLSLYQSTSYHSTNLPRTTLPIYLIPLCQSTSYHSATLTRSC